jgi:hypothetical protein
MMTQSNYQPTAEQLVRDEAMKRFNRVNVTLPLVIAVLIALGLFITLTVFAFLPNFMPVRSFISGLADLVIILFSIPMIVLCAIPPIAYLAIVYRNRQQRQLFPQSGPMAYRSKVQTLFWLLESKLDQVLQAAEKATAKQAELIMNLHARFEYYSALIDRLQYNFRRRDLE